MSIALTEPTRADLELLEISEVAALMKCSPRAIYNHVEASRFPRPFKMGRSIRWRAATVRQWLDEKSK